MSDSLAPNALERARRAARGRYIDLASSNPTAHGLLFPPDVLRAAAEPYWATRRYEPDPRGQRAAREAIAAYYATRVPPLVVDPQDIFITASTSEAYSLLFALLAAPGDNLLTPAVTYPLLDYLADFHHVAVRPYALVEARGWAVDAGDVRAQCDARTRALVLISPHNPTGHVVRAAFPEIADLELPVICDEVFADAPYALPAVPPLGALWPDTVVFHLNGTSKLMALPDMKLGWIALSGPARARRAYGERLALLNDTFLSANALMQAMLPELFAHGDDFRAALRARVRANLDYALARLGTCARVTLQAPDGGYYLFPRLVADEDEEQLALDLLARGVLVYPGYFYEAPGTHLMLACLAEPGVFQEGVERLLAGLESPLYG